MRNEEPIILNWDWLYPSRETPPQRHTPPTPLRSQCCVFLYIINTPRRRGRSGHCGSHLSRVRRALYFSLIWLLSLSGALDCLLLRQRPKAIWRGALSGFFFIAKSQNLISLYFLLPCFDNALGIQFKYSECSHGNATDTTLIFFILSLLSYKITLEAINCTYHFGGWNRLWRFSQTLGYPTSTQVFENSSERDNT
mgnify:CR=1 FL=1